MRHEKASRAERAPENSLMQLYVGLTTLIGHVSRYADRFDLLEFRFDPSRPPTTKALRRLRASAPEELLFSVLVPAALTAGGLEEPERLAPVLEAAELLRARWIVLQTGADVGPSPRARARLTALAARCAGSNRRVAWEPRGPWEPEAAHAFARTAGITAVEDLSMVEAPSSGVVYTRLRVPGPGAQLRGSALERLAERIADAEECYVVVEGRASGHARSRIEQALGIAVAALEEENEDEAEEELVEEDGAMFTGELDTEIDEDDSDEDDSDED
ncbi:MAG TPA: DUF72 domain-containing protein, partial [Polyangiaceae bacterium]